MDKNIKAFVFDMDGVILDTETICEKTWKIAGDEMNLDNINDAFHSCLGVTKVETYSILEKRYGEKIDTEAFLKRTGELFSVVENTEGIDVMPYAEEALKLLKKAGYRIALASSTRSEAVTRQLKNAGLIQYFEVLATGDLVTHSKPDPEIYLLACKMLGEKPEDCVAVEDSINGIKSAHNAGLKPIMVPDKVMPPESLKPLLFRLYKSLKGLEEWA